MRTPAPTDSLLFQGDNRGKINTPSWMQYFQQMHDYYLHVLRWTDPESDGFGTYEPSPKFIGLQAYADGVNWSPDGTGVGGQYEWNGTAWVLLGGSIGTSPASSVSSILYDLAGSGRKFYVEGVNITMGTDDNENPKEYFELVVKEL